MYRNHTLNSLTVILASEWVLLLLLIVIIILVVTARRSSARRCGIGQISSTAELLMIMEHDTNFIHHSLAIELNDSQLKEVLRYM